MWPVLQNLFQHSHSETAEAAVSGSDPKFVCARIYFLFSVFKVQHQKVRASGRQSERVTEEAEISN